MDFLLRLADPWAYVLIGLLAGSYDDRGPESALEQG